MIISKYFVGGGLWRLLNINLFIFIFGKRLIKISETVIVYDHNHSGVVPTNCENIVSNIVFRLLLGRRFEKVKNGHIFC
jgi:hypothetical protein